MKILWMAGLGLLSAGGATLCAQQLPPVVEKVDVTTVEPMALDASRESSSIEFAYNLKLQVNSVADFLRVDSSADVQARGGNGVQTDLSIRGTTFEQTLLLVNGLRINDPETGHLNFDLPIPLEALSRIDILHGAGSTVYGSDAIGGVVNLVTAQPKQSDLLLQVGFGSFGGEEQHLRADYNQGAVAEQLSGSRDVSDGFLADRGYHENLLASETWLLTRLGTTDLLLSASDRPYGANRFYGAYPSFERTKSWFASVEQQLGARTAASLGFVRHTDEFVLFNKQPAIYENNHVATVWEGAVRRVDKVGAYGELSSGVEADFDSIRSSNLGQHGRNNGAGYLNLQLNPRDGRFMATVGAREEIYGGGSVFSPSAGASFRVRRRYTLRASAGHGFRLPSYTDLYYSDPASVGNPNLKPESAWSYDGGLDWKPGGHFSGSLGAFRLQQKDSIDYSKYSLAAKWQATNISSLNLTGAQGHMRIQLGNSQEIHLSYTAVRAAAPPAGLISEYAYNYAAQNARFAWSGTIKKQVNVFTAVGVVQRTGHTAYPLWDVSASRALGKVRPYVRLTNLANTGYVELPGVVMQGRAVMAGVAYSLR